MWCFALLSVCVLSGLLAWRKGYSFLIWFFAAGIIGLIIICLLPYANLPHQSYSEQEELQKKGDMYGIILIVLGGIIACFQLRSGFFF